MPGTLALSSEQEAAVRAALDKFALCDRALAELLLCSGYRTVAPNYLDSVGDEDAVVVTVKRRAGG